MEIYKSSTGIEITVLLDNETIWATQRQMSEIFDTTPQNITLHLKKVYSDGEIDEKSTCKEYLQVQTEGKRRIQRKQLIYNLDAILITERYIEQNCIGYAKLRLGIYRALWPDPASMQSQIRLL